MLYQKNDARKVMVVENSLEIFVQAKICGIISATVNLEDMVNDTYSCNINPEQNLHQQLTQTQMWKLKVKKLGVTKSPPPQRQNRMLCAILCCKNSQNNKENIQYVLSYNEPDLCNDYISKEQGRNYRFSINFWPLNDVDL